MFCYCITASLDTNIVVPDVGITQVVYEKCLQTKSQQYHVYFLRKDGHLVCSCFHHLIMAAFVPTLSQTQTIAGNQWNTAAATFGAGAMKHKEKGCSLFHDDHVRMVGFRSGFATDSIVSSLVL